MNLNLIERRFELIDAKANFLNYKFNPKAKKILGISKHPYEEVLKEDQDEDYKNYGKDPFYTKLKDSD